MKALSITLIVLSFSAFAPRVFAQQRIGGAKATPADTTQLATRAYVTPQISALSGRIASTTTTVSSLTATTPAPYLGQVATRCQPPRGIMTAGTGRWQMTRSAHWSRDRMVSPRIVFANWRIGTGVSEVTYGAGTIKASIEYPAGVFTLSNENIAASSGPVAFPVGNTTLTFNVTIPKNVKFNVRVLQVNDNGTVFGGYQSNQSADPDDAWESGTGTVSDKTTSGTFSANVITYAPVAILAQTVQPSVLIIGDSRQEGGTEGRTDITSDLGEIARSVGPVYGYTSFAISGTRLSDYLTATRTYRDALIGAG